MKKNGKATYSDVSLNAENHEWKLVEIKNRNVLCPEWDSIDNIRKMDAIKKELLQNCKCQKSQCGSELCGCRQRKKECTKLCNCIDCKNNGNSQIEQEDSEDKESEEDTDEGEEEDDDDTDEGEEENEEEENNEKELVEGVEDIRFSVDCPGIQFLDDDELGHQFITLTGEFDMDGYDLVC